MARTVQVSLGGKTRQVIVQGGALSVQSSKLLAEIQALTDQAEASAAQAAQANALAQQAVLLVADKAPNTVTQLGTGAVSRTQQAISRDFFWAESYGAVGDGITNDTTAIQRGINYLASIGGGDLRFKSKNYAIGSALDLSNKHNVRLIGEGVSSSGRVATFFTWTGAAGGTMLLSDSAINSTSGIAVQGIAFNGNLLANRAIDWRGVTRGDLSFIRLYRCNENHLFMDISSAGFNSQNLTGQTILIDALEAPGSNGWVIGPGSTTQDTCFSTFVDVQIQHLNGVGLDMGSSDTVTFIQPKIYRYPGGTGKGLICRAGTTLASHYNWSQGDFFIQAEIKPLDGSLTDYITVETGVRPSDGNVWSMLDQSGTEYPSFKGNTVLTNIVTSERGYELFKGVYRRDRDGRVTYGGNYDENAIVTFAGDDTKSLERLYGTNGISGQRRYDRSIDTSSQLVTTLRNDAGAVVRIIGYDMPTGGFVRQYSGADSFKHLSLGHINLTPIANVPGNAANGSIFFLDGTGAKAAGLWIVRNGATYRLTDVAG